MHGIMNMHGINVTQYTPFLLWIFHFELGLEWFGDFGECFIYTFNKISKSKQNTWLDLSSWILNSINSLDTIICDFIMFSIYKGA